MLKWLKRVYRLLTYRFKKPSVTVTQAVLCGDNSFVYVRYFLSRPDKINENAKAYLKDEETGEKLELMNFVKFGRVRTKHNRMQPNGMLIFRNANEIIKKDSNITLYLDGLTNEHIKVE